MITLSTYYILTLIFNHKCSVIYIFSLKMYYLRRKRYTTNSYRKKEDKSITFIYIKYNKNLLHLGLKGKTKVIK